MGIRGLMTYMNGNYEFFNSYELHGGYLVIDGHSLAAQLYTSSKCNCAFGGDYDRYDSAVDEFFDDLVKCKVVPLVILDGGMENKKLKTCFERMKEKLESATQYTPASQSRMKFMPLAMMPVFQNVLKRKRIKICRSVLEADSGIAGVAKTLNCPVLSYDSDFFIFGVAYIPINTLDPYVVRKDGVKGYVKRCKLFRVENIQGPFPGLDPSVLPLAAILLGNDYVKSKTFKNFFNCLKLCNQNQRLYNDNQRRIDTVLRWLKNYNLNEGVAAILSKLGKKHRRKVLNVIELVINGYRVLPRDTLVPLGFEVEYEKIKNLPDARAFKFQGNVDDLESKRLWREECMETNEDSSDEEKMEETFDLETNEETNLEKKISDTWPSWFYEQYAKADFPTYFVDMMHLRLFTVPTQIEDFKYPSAYEMSLKIVKVIDGLLVAGSKNTSSGLSCFVRDGKNFVRRQFDKPAGGTRSIRFPPLAQLRDTAINIRKKIIDDTLELTEHEKLFKTIPSYWRLYIATIYYWMKRSDEPLRSSTHMYAILFAMLLSVVDEKIGYHRSQRIFNKVYGKAVTELASRKISKPESFETYSIDRSLDAVTVDDCLTVAPFFISHCAMDQKLVECPRKFNVTIVHVFSQFQGCLRQAMDLNTLLGCPYENPIIAEFYNGTIIYNLYANFQKRSNVVAYLDFVLEKSPNLLIVWKILSSRMNIAIGEIAFNPRNGMRIRGRKKNRNKNKIVKDDKLIVDNETVILEGQSQFKDPQNSFNVLGM